MTERVPAAILAGGRASRLGGGDKGLLHLGGTSILARIMTVLAPQTAAILINANSAPEAFAEFGRPVRADVVQGQLGPLAGILTAMIWAAEFDAPSVLTVSCDTPFLPETLVAQLLAAHAGDRVVIAASGGRLHPVIGLWPTTLVMRLQQDIGRGVRRVREWLDEVGFVAADFSSMPDDPFRNINTPADLARAEADLMPATRSGQL